MIIILSVLIIFSLDDVWTLLGENWWWSLAKVIEYIEYIKHHVYDKRQTQICTTWPRFLFTCRLLFIIPTHKLEISRNFVIHKNCFELFSSAHFLFWEILILNLTLVPFAVYVKLRLSIVCTKVSYHCSVRAVHEAILQEKRCSMCQQSVPLHFTKTNATLSFTTLTQSKLWISNYPVPSWFFRDNLQHCSRDFCQTAYGTVYK